MAEKTSIDSVGPLQAQFKNSLTSLEKNQVNAIRNMGGSLTARDGSINGDVAQAATRVNNHQKSAMELGANIAAKLERVGAFSKGAEKILTPAVTSTVNDKLPLPQKFPKNPIDMGKVGNRMPYFKYESPQQKIQRKKESLVGVEDLNYGGSVFPPDLKDNAAAYVELWFWAYNRPSPTSPGSINPDIKIWLPLPENFSITHEIAYTQRDMGLMGHVASSDAAKETGMMYGGLAGKTTEEALDILSSKVSQTTAAEASAAIAEVAKRAVFAGLNTSEEVLGGMAGRIAGEIPNPHPTVFFKGLELRQFTWTWKLVPRSADEAATIKNIIKQMRQRILPERAGNFLKYPHVLQPSVLPSPDLYGKFQKSAVKSFTVNYTAEGTSAFFVDGAPVSVNIIMTFQEMENMASQDV